MQHLPSTPLLQYKLSNHLSCPFNLVPAWLIQLLHPLLQTPILVNQNAYNRITQSILLLTPLNIILKRKFELLSMRLELLGCLLDNFNYVIAALDQWIHTSKNLLRQFYSVKVHRCWVVNCWLPGSGCSPFLDLLSD
jgi:hypothetical protein